jgi:hypothetical protein
MTTHHRGMHPLLVPRQVQITEDGFDHLSNEFALVLGRSGEAFFDASIKGQLGVLGRTV